MCSRLRGKIIIFFSYISVIAIGILIYLVVFLFAEKRQNMAQRDDSTAPQIPQDSTPPQNPTSINELPNEIDTAIVVIESPIDDFPIISTDEVKFPKEYIVEAKILNIRTSPSTKAPIMKRFKKGAVISISEIDGEWAKLENGGFAFLPLLKEKDL